MPRHVSRPAAVAEIGAIADAAPRRTVFVGIDGLSASGKTTLAALVAAVVPRAVVVHADDFAAPSIPEWDWERLRSQVIVPLLTGRPGNYQRWDWATDQGAEWHEVPTRSVVVVEGVSSTRAEVNVPWDFTVWVEAPYDLRLARARVRDPAMVEQWWERWRASEDAYVARERPESRVDVVVDGAAAAGTMDRT